MLSLNPFIHYVWPCFNNIHKGLIKDVIEICFQSHFHGKFLKLLKNYLSRSALSIPRRCFSTNHAVNRKGINATLQNVHLQRHIWDLTGKHV